MSFIENNFWFLRGVAPNEAKNSLVGKNGRVSNDIALTNRGNETVRLGFGLNKSQKGINLNLLDEFFPDLNYYSVLGAHAEKGIDLRNSLNQNLSGFILIFATPNGFEINKANLKYGNSWKTTTILPDDIDKFLVGVIDSCPISGPSSSQILNRKDGFKFYPGLNYKDKLNEYLFEVKDFKTAFIELIKYLDRKL